MLLVRAAAFLTVAGQWFLPGGGLEHGEDPVAGLEREFAEETGLEVEVGPLRDVMSDTFTLPDGTSLHTVRIIYAIDSFTGTLRDEVDGSSDIARWVRSRTRRRRYRCDPTSGAPSTSGISPIPAIEQSPCGHRRPSMPVRWRPSMLAGWPPSGPAAHAVSGYAPRQ